MSDFFEEFGFTIVAAVCAMIIIGAFMTGIDADGFIGKFITDFAQTNTGG